MKTRISQLHNTEEEWLKFNTFIPLAGEFVIYDPDNTYTYARIKVGDGSRTLTELPFFTDESALAEVQKHRHFEIIDAGRVTEYK